MSFFGWSSGYTHLITRSKTFTRRNSTGQKSICIYTLWWSRWKRLTIYSQNIITVSTSFFWVVHQYNMDIWFRKQLVETMQHDWWCSRLRSRFRCNPYQRINDIIFLFKGSIYDHYSYDVYSWSSNGNCVLPIVPISFHWGVSRPFSGKLSKLRVRHHQNEIVNQ